MTSENNVTERDLRSELPPKIYNYLQDASFAICRSCMHNIFLKKDAKGNTEWVHISGMVLRRKCVAKTCPCGGDGFAIYGANLDNMTCGICQVGTICKCQNPEPAVIINPKK